MSHDLLIAFDEPEPSAQPKYPSSFSDLASIDARGTRETPWEVPNPEVLSHNDQAKFDIKPRGHESGDENDDDDFGDFEDASPPPVPAQQPASAAPPQRRSPPPMPKEVRSPFPPKAPRKTAKPSPSPKPPTKKESVGSHPFAGRMDLLFSMDNEDDYDAGADELGDLANDPEAAMAYSKRIIAEQQQENNGKGKQPAAQRGGFIDLEEVKGGSVSMEKGVAKARERDPSVLFDADDVSEHADDDDGGDDFGEFETWDEPTPTTQLANRATALPTSALDLLSLEEASKDPKAFGTARSKAKDHVIVPRTSPPVKVRPSKFQAQQQDYEDDRWDDFEALPSSTSNKARSSAQPRTEGSWDDFETAAPSLAELPPPKQGKSPTLINSTISGELPPTNIPPPVVLLTLFPALFASADDALFAAMGKLDIKARQMLLSHPASHQFLRGYLSHCVVLARIIAGRKLRWKRDQRLSQSMRIGPAAAGGKGGMKLTGLGKSEVAKEDREVLDAVRLYRAQIGKLRSAVTAASAAPGLPKLPAVPDMSETMPVKALKQSEGGITAREACALCGLRREERVVKIAEGAEDSFGEWWVQGMNMHLGCRTFWQDFEKRLKGR